MQLEFARNSGAAFSAFTELTIVLTILAIGALVAIIWTDLVTGDKSVSQSAYITSCEVSAPMEDVTTYSIEFAGTGAPTFATIA